MKFSHKEVAWGTKQLFRGIISIETHIINNEGRG